MKIAVLIKSVPDTATVLRVEDDSNTITSDDYAYVVNPYDEYALEEAIRLKEVFLGEVIAVSMGGENAVKALRTALAMGADRAIQVEEPVDICLASRGTSKVLAEVIKTLSPDLVFAGKQAVDDDASQVPERVAEILGLPHVSAITRLSLDGDTAQVDREIEGGYHTIDVTLPGLFTTHKGINNPRYPILPKILKAQRAVIEKISLKTLGLHPNDLETGIHVDSLQIPLQKRLGKIVTGDPGAAVKELIGVLSGMVNAE